MSTLTDEDRARMTKLVTETEQQAAMEMVAIHEASHAIAYWHFADGKEHFPEDVILTLIWDAGHLKGCCSTPLLPARPNAIKSIAGIVGESVITLEGTPTAEQFREFSGSDFEIPVTDPVAIEWAAQKKELATEAAEILLANFQRVQAVANVLIREGAVGRRLFRSAMLLQEPATAINS